MSVTAVLLFNILVGAALLFLGRRLFWLFVACVGFVVGTMLGTEWFGGKPDGLTMVIALAVGVIGALVSIFLQRLAVAIAGFLAGGYLLYTVAFALKYESLVWIAFVAGGVLGAVLVLALFDWALIFLSASTGATVIAQNVSVNGSTLGLLFLVLFILGVIVQARQLTRPAPAPEKIESMR
jgi:hypothetical protein